MVNPYLPIPVTIRRIIKETEANDIKTFELVFCDEKIGENFTFTPGQFMQISLLGVGECPLGIASSPMEKGYLQFTVKRAGVVTSALHSCAEGEIIGLRGPYGNGFPLGLMESRDIVIVGGGFAFTTLRCLAHYILHEENRGRFGKLTIIYGARTPGDLSYKYDLETWGKREDLNLYVTVDKGDEKWKGRVGFVPTVLKEVAPESKNAVAIICGPPIMIKVSFPILLELGFPPERILNSLEMRMKCGIGKCGRCNIGNKYVCKDGPVFSYKELQDMPKEY